VRAAAQSRAVRIDIDPGDQAGGAGQASRSTARPANSPASKPISRGREWLKSPRKCLAGPGCSFKQQPAFALFRALLGPRAEMT